MANLFIYPLIVTLFFLSVQVSYGDDTEDELGLCLNYHIKAKCDKLEIEKIINEVLNHSKNPD